MSSIAGVGGARPGVRRLRPDDHFMVLIEDDATPMHIGALLVFDRAGGAADFSGQVRAHIASRLPGTPLLATLRQAPEGRSIQASMAAERQRTPYDEMMLDAPERPCGARDRRAKFAERPPGAAVLPGNVSLSNVPGPDESLTLAGHRLLANHPTPIIGGGRFLNVTSRRLAAHLDLGIIVNPTRIDDAGAVAARLIDSLDEYEQLSRR